jgi:dimethylglycine dehydrogenase
MWGTDMTRDYTPFESGLDRFVRLNKGEFVGRAALEKQKAAGVPNHFVTLQVHEVSDADPLGNEPLFDASGKMVGRATAGSYGHAVRQSLAIGYVVPQYSALGTALQIEILGKRHPATVVHESPYDPENVQLRS